MAVEVDEPRHAAPLDHSGGDGDDVEPCSVPIARIDWSDLRSILATAGPIAWSSACWSALMMTLSLFAGRISLLALGAVGLNEIVLLILSIQPAIGLGTGAATRMAHAFGAGRPTTIGVLLQQTAIVMWCHALIVTPLLWVSAGVLEVVAGVDPEIARVATSLNHITIMYPLLNATVQMLSNFLIATKHAHLVSLPNLFVITLTPLALWLLIDVAHTGVLGLGAGYLFSLVVEGGILAVLAWRYNVFATYWVPPSWRLLREGLRNHARDCITSMFMITAAWTAMEVVFLYMSTFLDPCEMATSAVVHQTRYAFFVLPGAVSSATGIEVAHLVGRLDPGGARRIARVGLLSLGCVLALQGAAVLLTVPHVPRWFSSETCVAHWYGHVGTWLVVEQTVEALLFFHVIVMRSLHRSSEALITNVVSWWFLGFGIVLLLGSTLRAELRMNVGLIGVCLGQLCGLSWSSRRLWLGCSSSARSPWAEGVAREQRRRRDASSSADGEGATRNAASPLLPAEGETKR